MSMKTTLDMYSVVIEKILNRDPFPSEELRPLYKREKELFMLFKFKTIFADIKSIDRCDIYLLHKKIEELQEVQEWFIENQLDI